MSRIIRSEEMMAFPFFTLHVRGHVVQRYFGFYDGNIWFSCVMTTMAVGTVSDAGIRIEIVLFVGEIEVVLL